MGNSVEATRGMDPEKLFEQVVSNACRMPLVRIERDTFLRKALRNHCPAEQVEDAIATTPAQAGISLDVIRKAADASITWESTRVTAISTATGIPGGFAMAGTVPADLTQNFAHVLRVAQKLAYLCSWPDLALDDEDGLDDATKQLLVLFVGTMFGVNGAAEAITKVSAAMAAHAAKKLPQMALTKVGVYAVTKQVAKTIGIQMNKQIFSQGVSKIIPVVGGVISGGMTWATFRPMCAKLRNHLAGLGTAKPVVRD